MSAERTSLNPTSDPIPTATLLEEVLQRSDTRRGFGAKALALLVLINAACSESERPAVEKLDGYVRELPESPIKTLLTIRTLPYFRPNFPASINIAGKELPVYETTLVEGRLDGKNQPLVYGQIYPRNPNIDQDKLKQVELRTTETKSFKIPLPDLLHPDEIKSRPDIPLLNDGTPYHEVSFDTDTPLYEGMNPLISVSRRSDVKQGHPLEKFLYVKELAGFLVHVLYLQRITQKSHELGLPTTIKARKPSNEVAEVFALQDGLAHMESNFEPGRFVATQDRTAYIVAAVAFQGSETSKFTGDPTFVELMRNASRVNLGSTEEDVIKNALAWSRDSRNVPQLQVTGDMRRFP